MRIKSRMHAPIPFAVIMACCFIITVTCMSNLDLSQGGSGTEIGNPTVTGKVVDANGIGAANTRINLYPYDYEPARGGEVKSAITDAHGGYSLQNVGSGAYNLIAVGLASGMKSILCGITISEDPVALPDAVLRQPSAIKVTIPEALGARQGFVYIPGTNIGVWRNSAIRSVLLDSVPAGLVPPVYFSDANDTSVVQLTHDSITVGPADTLYIAYSAWKFSKTLCLNTTASGAGVAGTVMNFPLLIRLNSGNFPFGQAKTDGGDLRFTKSNGAPLPYEIERWDAGAALAEVWVKVDTVYGNNSSQHIAMYWGNPAALPESGGEAVFDQSIGFEGVWHLNENGDSVHDATVNAFHGANSGCVMSAGIIGNSRKFADGDYLKISGLLNSPSSVTLSAWVQSEKPTGGQDVISIGDAVIIRLDYFGVKGASGWYHNSPITSDDSKYAIDSSGRNLANTGWHYLTYAINDESHVQTLYIDGVPTVAINDTNPIYYAGLGADTYIGIHGNGKTTYNFGGQIDEVRVSGVAESPDWVKLCFMNQKVPDALVVFK